MLLLTRFFLLGMLTMMACWAVSLTASASAHQIFLCVGAITAGAGGYNANTCNAAVLKEGGAFSRAHIQIDPVTGFLAWYSCEKVGGSNYNTDNCTTTETGGLWALVLGMTVNPIQGPGKSKLVSESTGTVECGEDTFSGKPEEEGKLKGETAFHSCKVAAQPGCAVEQSGSFTDQLVEVEKKLEYEFKGTKGEEEFLKTVITAKEGKACTVKGTYTVKGTQKCELLEGTFGAVEHEISCKPAGSKLTVGGLKATYEDSEKITLQKETDWGVE